MNKFGRWNLFSPSIIMTYTSITTALGLGRILHASFSQRQGHRTLQVFFVPKKRSIRAFSGALGDSETTTIDPKHRKSYQIQGQSTSPTLFSAAEETAADGKSSRRRRRGSGPGVTLHTVKTHHTLQTDVPKAMGGSNLAPQPVETLLAALLGCTQATALFVGRQLGVVIDKMEFDITAARDERGALQLPIETTPEVPSRLQEISGTIKIYTPELLREETLHILKEQTETRCPVANMVLASGCQMNVDWISIVSEEEEG